MASFVLYTYQFRPISNFEKSIFNEIPSISERMDNKQTYFHNILSSDSFRFQSRRYGKINHRIYFNQGGIIILKLANNKHINLENDFMKSRYLNSPSCFVIIDNRPNIQRIAIEDYHNAFSATNVVRNILQQSFRKALKSFGLDLEIKKEYEQREFWTLIERLPRGASMVRFRFSYPNLPRVNQSIQELISRESKAVNSKQTTIEYRSDESEQLELFESNNNLHDLVKASADSGHPITIKIKGIRKYVMTGNSTKRIEIDNLETTLQQGDLFQDFFDKIVDCLNTE